jgi:hypothetical protein
MGRYNKRSQIIMKNIEKVKEQIKTPLKETAYMNATRWKLYQMLKDTLPEVETGTGALTKMNRIHHDLPKTHDYNALCTGISTPRSFHFKTHQVLHIHAKGRGTRYRSGTNRYGFPIRYFARRKRFFGFQTGDMVKAIVPGEKYKGIHYGVVATRSSGSFDIKNGEGKRMTQGVHYRHCQLVQRFDGYVYFIARREVTNRAIPPHS